jgi:hypothetical protein
LTLLGAIAAAANANTTAAVAAIVANTFFIAPAPSLDVVVITVLFTAPGQHQFTSRQGQAHQQDYPIMGL